MNNCRIIKKSRKEYKCISCGYKIQKGGSYAALSGVWEGDFYHAKLCLLCNEIMNELFATGGYEDGILFDLIIDSAREHDDEIFINLLNKHKLQMRPPHEQNATRV